MCRSIQEVRKSPNEIEAVTIAKKNIAFFYTTYDDVLKDVRNVNASRAGHGREVAEGMVLVKFLGTSPKPYSIFHV